jgi:hypothetical protein
MSDGARPARERLSVTVGSRAVVGGEDAEGVVGGARDAGVGVGGEVADVGLEG